MTEKLNLPHGYTFVFDVADTFLRVVERWKTLDKLLMCESWQRPISCFINRGYYTLTVEERAKIRASTVSESLHLRTTKASDRKANAQAIAQMMFEIFLRNNIPSLEFFRDNQKLKKPLSISDDFVKSVIFPKCSELSLFQEAGPAMLTQQIAMLQMRSLSSGQKYRLDQVDTDRWLVRPSIEKTVSLSKDDWALTQEISGSYLLIKSEAVPHPDVIEGCLGWHSGLVSRLEKSREKILAAECLR